MVERVGRRKRGGGERKLLDCGWTVVGEGR